MKGYFFIGSALLFTTFFYSCSKSFLDTSPTDTYNEANWWKTQSQAISMVNGCYAVLQEDLIYGYQNLFQEDLTPNAYGAEFLPIQRGTQTPGNVGAFLQLWKQGYEGIGRTNYVLDNIDKVEMDNQLKQRLKGEARFLRAVYYFKLYTHFGGVPLILNAPNLEQGKLPRNTKQEVFDQIIKDLDSASSTLPVAYSGSSDIGRATKGAALAFKARALLYESKWNEAAEAANAVISLHQYSLFPDYRGLFLLENEHNNEVIFDVEYSLPNYSNQFNSYIDLQQNVAPTLDLVNSYFMKDGKSIEESGLYDPDHPYDNRDPRLYQTIIIPGTMFHGKIATTSKYFGTGFGFKKYTTYLDDVPGPDVVNSDLNFIVLRYGDVLLMYAEAHNESAGADASVYDALNQIRDRAGMPHIPEGLSKEQMREVIRHERRVELAGECLYYNDIKRWHTAEIVNNADVLNSEGKVLVSRVFDPNRDYLWAIATIAIQDNPALEQNPGY